MNLGLGLSLPSTNTSGGGISLVGAILFNGEPIMFNGEPIYYNKP